MKKALFFFATLCLCSGIQISLPAQRTATWKGGTPGRAADWNCAANWREGRVPNAFSDVLIPDVSSNSNAFPAISGPVEGVNMLTLHSGAQLIIQREGSLEIYCDLILCDGSRLQNFGTLLTPGLRADNAQQARSLFASGSWAGYCRPDTSSRIYWIF